MLDDFAKETVIRREEIKQTIIDSDLSKVEKLKIFSEYDLMEEDRWLCHPFEDLYGDEYTAHLIEIAKNSNNTHWQFWANQGHFIIDEEIYDGRQRHEIIDLGNYFEGYLEDEDGDQMITVLTNRTITSEVFKVPMSKVVDDLYNWCVTNNIIRYAIDW